jgi:hypothetical protein
MSHAPLERSAGEVKVPGVHVQLFCQIKAEWIKLRSVRSTWICLVLIIVVGVGLGALISIVSANAWSQGATPDRLQYDPVRTAQAGVLVAQFVVGVIGVLCITSEYSSGLIRTTLTSATHRVTSLVAKVIVVSAVLFVTGEITAFISYFVSRALLLSHGGKVVPIDSTAIQVHSKFIPVLDISSPGVLRATILVGVYITLLGLLGLALGFLIRHSAGAISIFVGILLVLPIIVQLLPSSVSSHFNSYMPNTLGSAMIIVTLHNNAAGGTFLGPVVAAALLAGYVVLLLGLGAWRLLRSDA